MRLRLLASTQSLVFFAPPEVHQSIADTCGLRRGDWIDSSHVTFWLLEQTCKANQQLHNLYLSQGADYIRRMNARWSNPHILTNKTQRKNFLDVIRQPERQTLEQLYGSTSEVSDNTPLSKLDYEPLQEFQAHLASRQVVKGTNTISASVLEQVEQEREVEFQVEEERQIQKPSHRRGVNFSGLHPTIIKFAMTGELPKTPGFGFENAFGALACTELGQKFALRPGSTRLLVSSEFMRTIVTPIPIPLDNYLVSSIHCIYSINSNQSH
jgi:hypothetical protein